MILNAAASVIAEVGYEAATMTAIAELAQTSIGAVYQYFPNKVAIARALRDECAREIESLWEPLDAGRLSVAELAASLIDKIVIFNKERPAYLLLLSAAIPYQRDPDARQRLRERFAAMFCARNPRLSGVLAMRIANVTLQTIKGLNTLYSQAEELEREELVAEYKVVLQAYLSARLEPS